MASVCIVSPPKRGGAPAWQLQQVHFRGVESEHPACQLSMCVLPLSSVLHASHRDLSNKDISGTLPANLGWLTAARNISLEGNRLVAWYTFGLASVYSKRPGELLQGGRNSTFEKFRGFPASWKGLTLSVQGPPCCD